jgi:hypothetical protein
MAVSFDSTTLTNATYLPRFVKHETVADRTLQTLPLAREDGDVLIAERYGTKRILVQGTLTGSSQADLESKIETFTELFSRPEKNLDIDWNGGTLRYVATCTRHEFDRDHFHISIVPWSAEFVVVSGEGKATSTTTAASGASVSCLPGTTNFSLLGSKPPRPTITLGDLDASVVGFRGVEYKNTNNGERLVITYPGSWGDDRTITIDCDGKTVQGNVFDGVTKDLNFAGVFPHFQIGTNNVKITLGGIVNQKSADDVVGDISNNSTMADSAHKRGQSFMVPYTDQTFQGITIAVRKQGSPGGNIAWRIETDNNGAPSGSLVHADATGSINVGLIGTSMDYMTSYSTNPFTLTANTVYWLVLSSASLDASNYYVFGLPAATYPRGFARFYEGGVWSDFATKTDLSFRILYGGIGATGIGDETILHTVTYYKTYL